MARRMIYKPMGARHGIDLGTPEALRRGVMHLFNVDFALEFPRKLPPNVKLVGPLLPEPPKPLPADLEVIEHPCVPGILSQHQLGGHKTSEATWSTFLKRQARPRELAKP